MHKLARAVSSCTGGNCSIPSVDWGASAWGQISAAALWFAYPDSRQLTYLANELCRSR